MAYYKVVQCRKCGSIQVIMAVKNFKCRKCRKNNPVRKCRIFYKDRNALKARDFCAKLKQEKKNF